MADFIYSLNSSTIRPTPILEKIAIAGRTGYGAIELWHDDIDLHLLTGGTLADIRKAADDNGLEVPTTIFLKGWWDTTGEEYEQEIDEIKRRLEQSIGVGATYAIGGPPLGEVDFELGARQYARLLEVGREFGVKPIMEFLGFSQQVNSIEAALRVMQGSGDADATTVLDPFHIYRGGGDVESITKLTADQIAISHFNDCIDTKPREEQHDPDRVMPGDGIFDLARYCQLLREVGYNKWLSLELFREDLWERDPEEVAREGLEKMQAVVEA
ncbi:MAG: sugar phosphate isomerase/epimerase [Planctomycetota bacterium]|nr:sugar phosphate isomerase/epimerase [Planctomycetota bacterium]